MSPHYDRRADMQGETNVPRVSIGGGPDDDALDEAAEALRAADVESAREEFDLSSVKSAHLDQMSIDELRVLARQLDVPDRSTITEQDELIAAIRRRL